MWVGLFSRQRFCGVFHCRSFRTRCLVAIRRFHVAPGEPVGVGRDMGVHEEVLRLELHCHQVVVFHRPARRPRQHRAQTRRHAAVTALHHGARRLHPCLVLVGEKARWWTGGHFFPDAQVSEALVLGQHGRQRRRAGAGESDAEELDLDRLLADLRVRGVPVLDLEAVHQRPDQRRVEGLFAELVEGRLPDGGADQDLQSLSPTVAAEVVEPGLRLRLGNDVSDSVRHLVTAHGWLI